MTLITKSRVNKVRRDMQEISLKAKPAEYMKVTVDCIGCRKKVSDIVFNLYKLGWANLTRSKDGRGGRTHHAWCKECIKKFGIEAEY